MDQGTAILLAAILSPVITFVAAGIIGHCRSKTERKERFFYEIFPKRLELYEDMIKAINYIEDTEIPFSNCKSAWELSSFYKEKCDALAALGFRCTMYGRARVATLLSALHKLQAETSIAALSLGDPLNADVKNLIINSFTEKARPIKIKLLDFIMKESGTCMVDNKIDDFLRDAKKKHPIKNKKKCCDIPSDNPYN